MTGYHFFFVGHDGHIVGRADRDCEDDLAALEYAEALATTASIEVWDAARFVARVKVGNRPLEMSDHKAL
jgi:hypothetical protein